MDTNRPRLLTPSQVADELQISAREVQRRLREHQIPGLKIGRLWRVSQAALDRYVENGGAAK